MQFALIYIIGSYVKVEYLLSSLHLHSDFVAAADGLIDLLWGVHLGPVYLQHNVSGLHASSETRHTTIIYQQKQTYNVYLQL